MAHALDGLCDLLQTHANRDKVVSLFSYALKLLGAKKESKSILAVSGKLAAARAVLRLFDTPAALRTALKYGRGAHEGAFWGSLGAAGSIMTLAYLHAEEMIFLLDTQVLRVSDQTEFRVRTAHKLFWSLSSTVGLLRSLRALYAINHEMKLTSRRRCAPERFMQASLNTTKLVLDVVHAVSWLPPGWLWGSQLSVTQASSIATSSAVLALFIHYNDKRMSSV